MQRQEVETLVQKLQAEVELLKKRVAKLEAKSKDDWEDWAEETGEDDEKE